MKYIILEDEIYRVNDSLAKDADKFARSPESTETNELENRIRTEGKFIGQVFTNIRIG